MSINPISAISAIQPGFAPEAIRTVPEAANAISGNDSATRSFGHMLTDAIAEVNQAQLHAGDMTTRFAAGEPMDIHQVMIASQEASVALNLALQVRNKLVDAYTEIMHVNV